MGKSILGLEIGSSNIKLIEVVRKGINLEVQKFSLIPTPSNCINNGVISDIAPIKQAIALELKLQGYRAKKVVAVVQSNHIIIRNATMDKHPEKVIQQLLDVKTEDYLPVEKGQYQIDFKITGEYEEDGVTKNRLVLVAAPNMVVLPMASLIKSLKLVPKLITIPSEALSCVFNPDSKMVYQDVGNVMVLDIGGKSATATILSDKLSILTRIIDFGFEDIKSIINNISSIDKIEGGHEYISTVIRPEIEYSIVSEIERIMEFYQSAYNTGAIKKIYLTGGGVEIEGIKGYIRDALNISVERLDNLDTVKDNSGMDFEDYSRFFVNILGAINGL